MQSKQRAPRRLELPGSLDAWKQCQVHSSGRQAEFTNGMMDGMPSLKRVADGVWSADTNVGIGLGAHLPLRMTVLQDAQGLLLISPIELDEGLCAQLDELGAVHTLIAPNRLHYRYLAQAHFKYPSALVLGAPGLKDAHPELPIDEGLQGGPISDDVDSLLIHGAGRLSEVVFLHKPSSTLVVTDLVFNVHEASGVSRWLLKWISGAYGKLEQSRICRPMTDDRAATAESIEKLLQLPFRRIVPAHGDIVEEHAAEQLEAGLWWMRGERARPSLSMDKPVV